MCRHPPCPPALGEGAQAQRRSSGIGFPCWWLRGGPSRIVAFPAGVPALIYMRFRARYLILCRVKNKSSPLLPALSARLFSRRVICLRSDTFIPRDLAMGLPMSAPSPARRLAPAVHGSPRGDRRTSRAVTGMTTESRGCGSIPAGSCLPFPLGVGE